MSDDFDFDYSNSPLANSEFVRQASAQGEIAAALNNAGLRDTIVAAHREGNEFAGDGTFANDIMTLPYFELEARYGREVAENRSQLQETVRSQFNAQTADRTNTQVLGDTALGVGTGFVGLSGSLASGVLQGAGAVDEYFNEENTGLGELGVATAETTTDLTDWMRSFQSGELQERRRLSGIEGKLDALDSAAQEAREIADGGSPLIAGARRIGRDILNTGDRVLSDGAVAGDIISEALGSLGPSAKIASGTARLAGATIGRVTANETAQRVATTGGAAFGVGLSEASGVLAEASQAVMQLSHEQLSKGSDAYNAHIEAGLTPDQAKMRIAVETGREAFVRQLPAATALGLIAARFEASPIAAFRGSSLLNSMRQVGAQALEETGQGSIGKFNENIAVRNNADDTQQLHKGVGEAAATGLIAGAGMSGALAAPSVGRQSVTDAASLIGDALGSNTARSVRDGAVNAAASVAETARTVAEPVVNAVRDRAEGADTQGRSEGAQAARDTVGAAIEAVETGQASPELEAAVSQPDTTPAPEGVEGGSLLQTATVMAENLSNRSFKPNPAQTAYAAAQFSRLKGMMQSMPAAVRNQVGKMLNSPQVRKLQADARKVDLNSTQTAETEITTDVVSETVSVAKTNPTNVNPEVVGKILKESGSNLSDNDIRVMEGASNIAQAVNNHTGRQVEISQGRNVGLTRIGQAPKTELTQETASRSLRVEGYTDRRGNDLRSINDFAADIFEGAQSADGVVINQEGQSVPVQNVMQEFANFVEHMNNKVGALNNSFNQNNEAGRGPQMSFRGLVGGTRFVEADQFKNPVAYHRGNPNSVHFAQQVANDLDAAVAVYNEVRNTFPELFGSFPAAESTALLQDSDAALEIESAVENQNNPTAIDETEDAVEAPAEAVSEGEEQSQTEEELRIEQEEILDLSESLNENNQSLGQKLINNIVKVFPKFKGKIRIKIVSENSKELYQGDDVNGKPMFAKAAATYTPLGVHTVYVTENTSEASIFHELRHVLDYLIFGSSLQKIAKKHRKKLSNFLNEKIKEGVIPNDIYFDNDAELSNGLMSLYINDYFGLKDTFPDIAEFMDESFVSLDVFSEVLEFTLKEENTNEVSDEVGSTSDSEGDPVDSSETDSDVTATDEVSVDVENNVETGAIEGDPNVEIDQADDILKDKDGNPIKFYHGTNALFDTFNDGAIFLTSRKGLARKHVRRSEDGTPRLIEANARLTNPLSQQILNDQDPNAYWLQNALSITEAKKAGGFDSILIFNDKESIVIADRNDQVIQINKDFDNTVTPEAQADANDLSETPTTRENIHKSFSETYQKLDSDPAIDGLLDFVRKAEAGNLNRETLSVVRRLIGPLANQMNKRIADKRIKIDGKNTTLVEALKDGKVQTFRQYRNTAIVDPATGLYNQTMLEQAGIALVDWMMTATARDPSRLNEAMEDLGLTYDMVTEEQMTAIAYGLPPSQVKEQIARDVLRMWNVRENLDAPLGELEGIVQGVVSEMLTTLAQFTTMVDGEKINMVSIEDIPTTVDGKVVTTQTLVVRGLRQIQKDAKAAGTNGELMTARELLFGDIRETYSIGTMINGVARTQARSGVKLSSLEQAALKKIQDTPHFRDDNRVALFEALGFESLLNMLGYQNEDNILNTTLKNSVKGKNLSIIRNLEDADILIEALGDGKTPVFYPVSVSKVGRHQYQGVNPQSNKVLRALVTPTWSDLTFSKDDMDAFWLGVAQAADLYKVEKRDHNEILSEVSDQFDAKFRPAVDMVKEWLRGGNINGAAFANAMGVVEPQQIAAVHAVAEMEFAKENDAKGFRTSLSFELDGLTNGAANMMVHYGQGEITQQDFHNFNRIGLFLGRIGMTVNDFFKIGNKDLYEYDAEVSQANMFSKIKKENPETKEKYLAMGRFASYFGNFKIHDDDGSFEMTRNTTKSPMTKVNYGAKYTSVSASIAQDMILQFYKEIQNIPANINFDEYFGYPGIQQDISLLFGDTLPTNLGNGAFEFPLTAIEFFRHNVSNTIGKILTESTQTVIGKKIFEVNDMLVFSTNVQSQYLQLVFQDRIEALAEQRATEGRIRRDKKTNKPILADLSRRDYQSVVRELEAMSPIFVSDDQTLAIGGFQKQVSSLVLSSNMDGKLNQKAYLPFPDDVGVRATPYSVIGSGDAMMMNYIFGSEGAPNDVLGIFDGLDVPVGKVKEYAPYVNEQVLKTWERDPLAMVTQNYSGFLTQVGSNPLLELAFNMVKGRNKNSSVIASNATELLEQLNERHRQNKTRKAVLKRIPLSVDQMGGSAVGFSRGEGKMDLSAINLEIRKELKNTTTIRSNMNDLFEIYEGPVNSVFKFLNQNNTKNKVYKIIAPMLSNIKVVFGTIFELNTYRKENFPDDGQVLEGIAQYDSINKIIFSTTQKTETVLHEMVHAATFNRVLAHYNGDTHDAVVRLEALMEEFLALELNNRDYNEAKGAILSQLAQNDVASKAAAVNEFMAYALTNQNIVKKLKNTETRTIANLTKKIIDVMRRLMGGIPANMFDQVVFNTKVLNEPPIDNGGNGNGNDGDGGSNGENTPSAENYTNFWIDLIKGYIDDVKQDVTSGRSSGRALRKFSEDADAVIDGYRQVGMLSNNNARRTFKAIHMVMAAEMEMDSNTVIALTKVFQHIEANMTPDMFGSGPEAPQTYSAVINSFGQYKNGNVSDAVAVLLALSQTSSQFRAVLDQIPNPEGEAQVNGSLSSFLTQATSGLMRKVMGSIETNDRAVLDTMDALADSLIQMDAQREYTVMQKVTASFDAADSFVSGKMSDLSERVRAKNEEIKASTRLGLAKTLFNLVTLGTNLLNKYSSEQTAETAKRITHMNVPVLSLVPIREFVSEIIGTDRINTAVVALMDEVNNRISGMRQAYREDLPGILQNLFDTVPDAAQWSSMHTVLGKSDFTRFVDLTNLQGSMNLLEDTARRQKRISELEQAIDTNYLPYIAQDAKSKAKQLARFMNGEGAGNLLIRNAYAITKNLDGNFQEGMVEVIDELITMYALDQMDSDIREVTVQLWQNEPRAITGLITYIQGLNEAEDGKQGITENAKLNAYKGFIPNHGDKDTRIIIDRDERASELEKRGYVKLSSFDGDMNTVFPRSYYVTTTRQGGAYSQGVMQNVHSTYRGVDINTGLTVTGETSGFISGDGVVENLVKTMTDPKFKLDNEKETLLPVFDETGNVSGFERGINPDIYKTHMRQDENLAVMLGAWAGRHVEEMLADQYNRQLVDHLADIWKNREPGTEDLFINLKKTNDPIYAESYRLIPKGIKDYMDEQFNGDGPMVRKDMVNLSVGYREASLADMWSGRTRLPVEVQEAVTKTAQFFMGRKAMKYLANGEQAFQGIVSSAKDIIVIRSLIVPFANTKSNVIQLATRGVPTKQIVRGFRSKLAEIEEYNKNVSKKIELKARLRLAANNANQKRIIESQIQVIDDLNARMSIAPVVAAGAYKNLSEGITDLDVELSKGRIGDMIENLANKLPESVGNVAKIGLVSKSTKIYQVANRATQYGDFLAKSIYFDHLIAQGLSETDALSKINEEFVNFSVLPGRTRSYLETVGLTWFMAFKIRIAKIALQMLRDNPVRALAINNALPDIGSPVQDNILSVAVEGRLDYATGFEMLFSAPELNPWVNLLSE